MSSLIIARECWPFDRTVQCTFRYNRCPLALIFHLSSLVCAERERSIFFVMLLVICSHYYYYNNWLQGNNFLSFCLMDIEFWFSCLWCLLHVPYACDMDYLLFSPCAASFLTNDIFLPLTASVSCLLYSFCLFSVVPSCFDFWLYRILRLLHWQLFLSVLTSDIVDYAVFQFEFTNHIRCCVMLCRLDSGSMCISDVCVHMYVIWS